MKDRKRVEEEKERERNKEDCYRHIRMPERKKLFQLISITPVRLLRRGLFVVCGGNREEGHTGVRTVPRKWKQEKN